MSAIEKRIFRNKTDLQNYLTSLGFTIANNKMTWDNDTNTNNCYWTVANDGKMNFHTSTGSNAFHYNLVDFDNDQICGVIFIELLGGGCALYMTPLPADFEISKLTISCANNYDSTYTKITGVDLQNGLVVCTPAEEDDNWRYSWRSEDPTINGCWCIDDCVSRTSKGVELPVAKIIDAPETITLAKVYLAPMGQWSNHIFSFVLGETSIPGSIFRLNGQKYINFTDNIEYRSPCFKLPAETLS